MPVIKIKNIGRIFYKKVPKYKDEGFTGSDWGNCYELISIWVKEDKRHQGYGKQLVEELKQRAKEDKIHKILCYASQFNNSFRTFLKKNNFKTGGKPKILYEITI